MILDIFSLGQGREHCFGSFIVVQEKTAIVLPEPLSYTEDLPILASMPLLNGEDALLKM